MGKLSRKDVRTLVKAASLYYLEGKSQQEIAEIIGVSRPQVSRILQAAKDQNIVTFSIHDPYSEEHLVERQLVRSYELLDAIVADTNGEFFSQNLVDEGAALLNAAIKDGDICTVMGGRTISTFASRMGKISKRHVQMVPMTGGVSITGNGNEATDCARLFSEKLDCKYYQLNAPSFVTSRELAESIQQVPIVKHVLDCARSANTAIVTVAALYQDTALTPDPIFQQITIQALREHGAVATLGASFIDRNGKCVQFDGMTRMVGLSAEEIRKIPKVIALAVGAGKVEAIKAMLRGHWIDILVTDLDTAHMVLQ